MHDQYINTNEVAGIGIHLFLIVINLIHNYE